MVDRRGSARRGGGRTRERILVEASRLFTRHGYHSTSTRQIAEAVGVTQPALFFHFPSKMAIAEELARLDLLPSLERLEAMFVGRGSPAAKLLALLIADARSVAESPYDPRAQLVLEIDTNAGPGIYRELADRYAGMVRLLIVAAQESGQFIEVTSRQALHAVLGPLTMAILDPVTRSDLQDDDPAESAEIVIRGLLADPSRLEQLRAEADGLIQQHWR